jgi:hypothetical protein
MINKVKNINILLKFQSGQTISMYVSIRDILANNCKRLIENGIIFVDDKTNSDSIDNTLCHMARPIVLVCQS